MTTVNIVAWLGIGLIVGLVFAWMRRSETPGGLLVDLIVGIIGGFVGGILLNALGGLVGAEIVGVNLGGGVLAIVGAVILLGLWALMRGQGDQ
jgi:uncharacterized membrane protein YeaQ/YmgE (transglycosylase-associated protein family)